MPAARLSDELWRGKLPAVEIRLGMCFVDYCLRRKAKLPVRTIGRLGFIGNLPDRPTINDWFVEFCVHGMAVLVV